MNCERRHFFAQRQICGTAKQFRRRWATQTRAILGTRGYRFLSLGARFGDGWHNNRPGVSSPRSTGLRPRLGTCFYPVKPGCDHLSCGENVTFSAKKPLFRTARVSVSLAGFGSHCPGIGPTPASSDWYKARFGRRSRPGRTGRFYAPKVDPCTISCREKNVENQLGCGYTLAATTWLRCGVPPAIFVAQHVPN